MGHFGAVVSCDRGVALSLYTAGYTDMSPEQLTLINLENYLIHHGAQRINSIAELRPGDIVFYDKQHDGYVSATAENTDHVFIFDTFTHAYDWGSTLRIQQPEIYNVGAYAFSQELFGWAYRLP